MYAIEAEIDGIFCNYNDIYHYVSHCQCITYYITNQRENGKVLNTCSVINQLYPTSENGGLTGQYMMYVL